MEGKSNSLLLEDIAVGVKLQIYLLNMKHLDLEL